MSENLEFPRFIKDSPCGEDLFESGSQKKTALAIVEHIRRNTSSHKLIGLDGDWGAGKSNVISIVNKELGKSHHLFIYDAWSHQVDLQRRSFLEELTDDLKKNEIIDGRIWAEKLKALLSKRKETITKTIPKLSLPIVIYFLIVLLVPALKDIITPEKPGWLRILVSTSPILVGLIIWLIAAVRNKKYRNLTELLHIYKEKDLETSVNEIVSEKEPSVSEFRKWMTELSEDLRKDVIIVFDNMDRLPPEIVQSLWSSVHTFFSEHGGYNKIAVIVPFDRIHIREAFADNQEKANHFIDKTFSVIFNVSPIVLTDWREFFSKKYKEAFENNEIGEFNFVKSIFDRYQDTITPRKIIAFLNELVSLKLIWKDEIPLRYMAIFLLNKETIRRDPVRAILNKNFLEKAKLLFRAEDNVEVKIAAIVYNVPLSVASQVTLQRETLNAIRENNQEWLKELSRHPDFYDVLEEIFAKEEFDLDTSVLAIQTLTDSATEERGQPTLTSIWDILALKQLNTAIDTQAFTETHKILFRNIPQVNLRPLSLHILNQFANCRNFKGDSYFNAVHEMETFAKEDGISIDILSSIPKRELSPEDFVKFVKQANGDYVNYAVTCNGKNLEDYLLGKFPSDWDTLEVLPTIKNQYNFDRLKKSIESLIESGGITIDNLAQVFDFYKAVSKERLLSKKLADQLIHSLLTSAATNSRAYYELTAMRLARTNQFPNYGGISHTVLSRDEDDLANEVAKEIECYVSYGELLKQIISWPQPLLKAVGKKLTQKSFGTSSMNISEVLPIFGKIVDSINVTETELFQRLNAWTKYLKEKLTTKNLPDIIPDLQVYHVAAEVDNGLSNFITKIAQEYIGSLETETWKTVFADEDSYPFKLLYFLFSKELIKGLPDKALDAYKESLVNIANKNEETLVKDSGPWEEFYNQTDKRQIKSTIKNIRDGLVNSGNITPQKFLFFEKSLRSHGALEEKSGDIVRRILTPLKLNESCLLAMIDHTDYYAPLILNAGDERFDFIKQLRNRIESNPEDKVAHTFGHSLDVLLTPAIKINSARYFTEDRSVDVTEILRQMVQRENALHFKISNEALKVKDLHENVLKKLEIEFEYEGGVHKRIFAEGEWLSLP